jgi:hypothetical protein
VSCSDSRIPGGLHDFAGAIRLRAPKRPSQTSCPACGPKTRRDVPPSPASKFISDPRQIADATARIQSFQVSIGTLDKDVPLDGLFDPSFYVKATGGK